MAAGSVLVAPSDAVAFLQVRYAGTSRFDNADAFVADGLVGRAVVEVCAAEAGGGDFDEDLVALEVGFGGLRFVDLAGFLAFVDCEGGHFAMCLLLLEKYGARIRNREESEDESLLMWKEFRERVERRMSLRYKQEPKG